MIPLSSCPTPLQEEDLPSFEELQNSEEASESESIKPNEAGLFTQNDHIENLGLSQNHEANESGESANVTSYALDSVGTENEKLKNKSETVSKHATTDVETKKLENQDSVEGKERESLTSLSLATVDFDGEVMSDMIFSDSHIDKREDKSNGEVLNDCLEKLSVKFVENSHYFMGENESELGMRSTRIKNFLTISIDKFQPERGGTSSIMYVCGRPGTGKVRQMFENSTFNGIFLDFIHSDTY